MKRLLSGLAIMGILCSTMNVAAQDAPSLNISGKVELWYEYSDGVGGNKGDSTITANEIYLTFDAKYNDDLSAKVKLDGADIVSRDGTTVSEKIVEEANITAKNVCGVPLTLVFGKDEMPFGLDHDKALTDPIVHHFEIDKVWGLNGAVALKGVGSIGAAVYHHRHSLASDATRASADNEIGDNFAVRLIVDKFDNLKAEVSYAQEGYSDTSASDGAGGTVVTDKANETRWSMGAVYTVADLCKVYVEYIGTQNRKGTPDADPGVVSVGVEGNVTDKVKLHIRYEKVLEDSAMDVETDYVFAAVEYAASDGVAYFAEVMNFNSADLSSASGLADTSIDASVKLGARIKF